MPHPHKTAPIACLEVVRAAAALLILNSHLKGVYFRGWCSADALAFGGSMGVALFLVLSGFLQDRRSVLPPWCPWLLKSWSRLLIPFWLFSLARLVLLAIGLPVAGFDETGLLAGARLSPHEWFTLVLPLHYWFISVMVLLYPMEYGLMVLGQTHRRQVMRAAFGVCLAAFALWLRSQPWQTQEVVQNDAPGMIPFWLACLIQGHLLHQNTLSSSPHESNRDVRGRTLGCLGSMVGYAGLKWGMQRGWMVLQVMEPILTLYFAQYAFQMAWSAKESIQKNMESPSGEWRLWTPLIRCLSSWSLSMYLVQFVWIDWLAGLDFPINWMGIMAGVLISAGLLHQASGWLLRLMSQQPMRSQTLHPAPLGSGKGEPT